MPVFRFSSVCGSLKPELSLSCPGNRKPVYPQDHRVVVPAFSLLTLKSLWENLHRRLAGCSAPCPGLRGGREGRISQGCNWLLLRTGWWQANDWCHGSAKFFHSGKLHSCSGFRFGKKMCGPQRCLLSDVSSKPISKTEPNTTCVSRRLLAGQEPEVQRARKTRLASQIIAVDTSENNIQTKFEP